MPLNPIRSFTTTLALAFALASTAVAHAAPVAPDALVRQVSTGIIDAAKADKSLKTGDIRPILALVETQVMPHVDAETVTRSAVGPQWRGATPEQRKRLQDEFKILLVRVYGGAISQLGEQTVEITKTLPVPGSEQVVVQSEMRGKGEPIKLDYRLRKDGETWKVIDVNIGGLWLVQNYRTQFAQELTKGGVDGLISALAERNKAGAAAPAKS